MAICVSQRKQNFRLRQNFAGQFANAMMNVSEALERPHKFGETDMEKCGKEGARDCYPQNH